MVARTARGGNESNQSGPAILVFLPGKAELDWFEQRFLQLYNVYQEDVVERRENRQSFSIIQIHGHSDVIIQQKAFEPVDGGKTKIVLATNVAETSITIPDVLFVVDFCLVKVN